MKTEAIIELLLKAIPHPHQINQLELEPEAVRFSWRGMRYRVCSGLGVEEVGDGVLIGSDLAILLERMLRLAQYSYKALPA